MIKLIATRPPLSDQLVLRTATPLTPLGKYVIEITGLRNVNHVGGRLVGGVVVPKPPPPPKRPAVDSTKADSTKTDSTSADSSRKASIDTSAVDSATSRLRLKLRPPPRDSTKP